jgi:transcriptional regulator with XRE-family HTH domain
MKQEEINEKLAEIGIKCRKLRLGMMLSQRQMSVLSGLSRPLINRIENGKTHCHSSFVVYFYHLNYELEKQNKLNT